jgi:hypothetical protein
MAMNENVPVLREGHEQQDIPSSIIDFLVTPVSGNTFIVSGQTVLSD